MIDSIVKEVKSYKKSIITKSICDKKLIKSFNEQLSITKDEELSSNGFWAYVTKEQIDSDGDLILVDGITSELDAENGIYPPLLPSHQRKLPDASSPQIGRIERLLKVEVDGIKHMVMYATWALDEKGEPVDSLVKSYYSRYKLGYANFFSIGAEGLEVEPLSNGGNKYLKTHIYEVSSVSIPANNGAIGLTRSDESSEESSEELTSQTDNTITQNDAPQDTNKEEPEVLTPPEDMKHKELMDCMRKNNDALSALLSTISKMDNSHNLLTDSIAKISNSHNGLVDNLGKLFKDSFDPLMARLDIIEGVICSMDSEEIKPEDKKEDLKEIQELKAFSSRINDMLEKYNK